MLLPPPTLATERNLQIAWMVDSEKLGQGFKRPPAPKVPGGHSPLHGEEGMHNAVSARASEDAFMRE